jgi:hypothetical protein
MPSAEDVWKHFDWRHNRLAKLRILAANKELRKEIERETRCIRQKNSRNSNSAISIVQILDLELRKIDEWANTNYLIHCDLWKMKGHEKSAEFVRSIHNRSIRKLISARGNAVAHEMKHLARRTGNSGAEPHIASFRRRVAELDTEWRQKIEIEALELEARTAARALGAERVAPQPQSIQAPPTGNPRISRGVDRAVLVEKIRREIIEISQAIELPEDYDTRIRGKEAFAGAITVAVCNNHDDLRDKVCAIKTTNKPRIVEIASEIAARSRNNVTGRPLLPKTFHDAHKRYGSEARIRLDQHH